MMLVSEEADIDEKGFCLGVSSFICRNQLKIDIEAYNKTDSCESSEIYNDYMT